jgi:two-component sensor histidine kinase
MKTIFRFYGILLLVILPFSVFSQTNEGTATICGQILFEKDSVYPLKPYSIIIQKSWPITFSEFEQQRIDSTDNSFIIKMDLDQLTYGNIIINFFPDFDTTARERNGSWLSSKMRDVFFPGNGFISDYAQRIVLGGLSFVIEPGDSLYMVIDYNRMDQFRRSFVSFSGIGGPNNNFMRSRLQNKFYSRNFKLPLKDGLSNADLLMKSKLKELGKAKDSISPAYFKMLHTDIMFENLREKHALIRASLYGSDIKIEEKRTRAREYYAFMDTLTLKSEYLNSIEYRYFLGFYLEYINRIVTGRDVPYNIGEKSSYLAKAIFEKDILKNFLFERLNFQMDQLHFYPDGLDQYKDFIHQFPSSPESNRLTQIYEKRYPVSNGQPAPDLLLFDSLGCKKHLSDLKAKVVIITKFFNISRFKADQQDYIALLRKKFSNDKIVLVALNTRYQGSEDYLGSSFDYYVKNDSTNQNLNKYLLSNQGSYTFIIRKNGIIEDCVNNFNVSDETISRLILERYNIFIRLKVFLKAHTSETVFLLSFIFFFTLAYLLVTKLKQRRQNLIKKQLNSELKAIRSQLNPHFLFNSLNSIQNFINNSDTKTANMQLSRFALLMRKVIELSEKVTTSLKEELDFNTAYIELEKLRYGFNYKFDIDDTIDLYNTEIPSMIIQPFIENAIVHCMADLGEKGELSISVKEKDSHNILVEITDNGKGFMADSTKGFGLKSSQERIDLINSQNRRKIKLQIESPANSQTKKGSTIRMIIPKKY